MEDPLDGRVRPVLARLGPHEALLHGFIDEVRVVRARERAHAIRLLRPPSGA